ncbi:hypothetical protein GQ53DRAFT_796890 [Thozetella sp. PMI_491]|nr:hypothetical protein GQ53DRAFT_796890 [Thozetella sp. PMI_491]
MAVTERVIFSVKGGVEDWKEGLKLVLQTLKQQPGYLRTRWGPWSENMQKLDLLIGWESTEACETFGKSATFAEVMGKFQPVLDGPPSHYFVRFVPYAPKDVINAPIAEVITIPNCSANEDELRAQFEKVKGQDGCLGIASGYSLDEVNGGKVFVAAIGWSGVEVSKASDKSYIPANAGTSEIHHVNFNFPIKGFGGL